MSTVSTVLLFYIGSLVQRKSRKKTSLIYFYKGSAYISLGDVLIIIAHSGTSIYKDTSEIRAAPQAGQFFLFQMLYSYLTTPKMDTSLLWTLQSVPVVSHARRIPLYNYVMLLLGRLCRGWR